MKQEFLIDNWANDIEKDTKVYRYISLEDFISMTESKLTHFTRVINWEDSWEAPLRYLPRIFDDGKPEVPQYDRSEEYYAQCWTLLPESDAMWRIYSSDNRGIRITSTIGKFEKITNPRVLFCAKVFYYDELEEALSFAHMNKGRASVIRDGLVKRSSFKHEEEFRFIFLNVHPMVDLDESLRRVPYYPIEFDPIQYIEDITIDPRASDYYLGIVKSYCKRAGYNVVPHKSDLYSDNAYDKTNLVIRWKTKSES